MKAEMKEIYSGEANIKLDSHRVCIMNAKNERVYIAL